MALVSKKSKSRISGRIANMVFTAEGNVRIRSRRRGANGWSAEQKSQRERMKSVAALYKSAKYPLLECVWLNTMASRRVVYNNFVKKNLGAFDRRGLLTDPLMLRMTVGELDLPYNMGAVVSGSDRREVKVSWENNFPDGSDGCHDSLMGIFFNGESFSLPLDFKAIRKDNSAELSIPSECAKGCYMFLFFTNSQKTKISDSFSVRL